MCACVCGYIHVVTHTSIAGMIQQKRKDEKRDKDDENELERRATKEWERINDKMNRVPGNQVGFESELLVLLAGSLPEVQNSRKT